MQNLSGMDLLCTERDAECLVAPTDKKILSDPRVLNNLLKTEEKYVLSSSYFNCVQTEITNHMRKIVAGWMMGLCEEQNCHAGVFPLAMNYMDRYLALNPISKSKLQLLGAVCLLVASKLRDSNCLSTRLLSYYTANSVDPDVFPEWELNLVSTLRWNLEVITAYDFVSHILYRLPVDSSISEMVQRHSITFVHLACQEYQMCFYPASIVAGASVASALSGLGWAKRGGWTFNQLMEALTNMLSVEKDYLLNCHGQLEYLLSVTLNESDSLDKFEMTKAETPTDVSDVNF